MGRHSKILEAGKETFVDVIKLLHENPGRQEVFNRCGFDTVERITWYRWKSGESLPSVKRVNAILSLALLKGYLKANEVLELKATELIGELDPRIPGYLQKCIKDTIEEIAAIERVRIALFRSTPFPKRGAGAPNPILENLRSLRRHLERKIVVFKSSDLHTVRKLTKFAVEGLYFEDGEELLYGPYSKRRKRQKNS